MEALTLSKAIELYELLGKHVPKVEDENMDALDFIDKIVHNIRESKQPKDYTDAIMLMSGRDWEELKELEFDKVLSLFIEGLFINRIMKLKMFCEITGF